MEMTIFTLDLHSDSDIALARQQARLIADLLGFSALEQTRMATAVSEVARNAVVYAGGGKVNYKIKGTGPSQMFLVRVSDQGPGVEDIPALFEEDRNIFKEGKGIGLKNAKRLVDFFHIDSKPGQGTIVELGKKFPQGIPSLTRKDISHLTVELSRRTPQDSLEIVKQQNIELIRLLDELHQREEELIRVNQELDNTNRGVIALYAELEDKAEHLRTSDELKSRFLSYMSHEFRTPINSISSLSRILLDRIDGELTEEQEKQVGFIKKSSEALLDLVNDLLDLGRIEAGKIKINPLPFEVSGLFNSLQSVIRPIHKNEDVNLIFEEPQDIPRLNTDEGKVAQVMRNLIVNALKFTEKGEVRVSATLGPERKEVLFSVSDTGCGIAPENVELIFQEYTQISHLQKRGVKGTGLGLPLSRKIAEFLGGRLFMESRPGAGSTFTAAIPIVDKENDQEQLVRDNSIKNKVLSLDPTRFPVLIIEDDPSTMALYEEYLKGAGYQTIKAHDTEEAWRILAGLRPMAIILDILLPKEEGWDFLVEMKKNEITRDIPILVVTILRENQKARFLGAYDFCTKPIERQWLLDKLEGLKGQDMKNRILIIDDEDVSRYLVKEMLKDTRYETIEASDGLEGLRLAAKEHPLAIFLDLMMPEMDGFEVLSRLKSDPKTADIPVIIITAKALENEDRRRLKEGALAILSKEAVSREAVTEQVRDALRKIDKGVREK